MTKISGFKKIQEVNRECNITQRLGNEKSNQVLCKILTGFRV